MIIVLKPDTNEKDVKELVNKVESFGLVAHVSKGEETTVIGMVGDVTKVDPKQLEVSPVVDHVMRVSEPYKLANRAFHPEDSIIDVSGVKVGGDHLALIAAFQGMGTAGLDILVAAKKETGLPIVSELMSADYIDEFNEKVDLVQIGARNMQNFDLLKEVGKRCTKPILLKRGLSATYEEWIMSAEYIMASGNPNVILCERGIRTFESYTRNTLDIIDPSHAGGKWWLVEPMAKAAVAAGCDGLMIEVHNDPEHALCDGPQSLKPKKYTELLRQVKGIGEIVGKHVQ